MPKTDAFDAAFATLRGVLAPHAKNLLVQVDQAKELSALAKAGIAALETIELPWAKPRS